MSQICVKYEAGILWFKQMVADVFWKGADICKN